MRRRRAGAHLQPARRRRRRPRPHARDLRGRRCVLNEPWSHSGVNAIRPLFADLARDGRFFSSVRFVGGHLASLEAIAQRRADFAAIDEVTATLLRRHCPNALAGFRVLGTTAPACAPPLVCAAGVPDDRVAALRRALDEVVAAPALAEVREALGLLGFVDADFGDYEPMLAIEREARAAGYLELFAEA
ncbi:MAG: PhnD/SsuA/transferrin family substrate-binding protein [Planctomycetota bacterium]